MIQPDSADCGARDGFPVRLLFLRRGMDSQVPDQYF